jgi:hypothetical protein
MYPARIIDKITGYTNGIKKGVPEIINFNGC